jgi:hypothetical protein
MVKPFIHLRIHLQATIGKTGLPTSTAKGSRMACASKLVSRRKSNESITVELTDPSAKAAVKASEQGRRLQADCINGRCEFVSGHGR